MSGLAALCCSSLPLAVNLSDFPFDDDNTHEMIRKISQARVTYPQTMSRKLQAFISSMLQTKPNKRPNFAQMLNDPWIKELPTEDWVSLRDEVISYAPKQEANPTSEKIQVRFNSLISFFLRKFLYRNLEVGEILEVETFTTKGTNELEMERLEGIFAEELTGDVERWKEGPVSYVS